MRNLPKLLIALCALLCPSLACGQSGVRWDGTTISPSGKPVSASVAVCNSPGLTTTAATVIGNTAILTMSSNPITAGFASNMSIVVSGFTGGDTYFNVGTLQPFSSTVTISAVSISTITFPLTHANASASTNGSVFQMGNVATPCAPLANIYSDANVSVPITQPGLASSNIGNIGFYVNPGQYAVQYYGSGIQTYLQPLTLTFVQAASNTTFTGANTLTNTLSSATSATIDGVSPNLVTLDFRGTTVPSNTSLNKTIAYNINTVGNTNSMVREQMTVNSIGAAGSVLTHYFVTSLSNATGGNVVDGVSTEAQTTGTFSGTLGSITGNESVSSLLSTGGTVSVASGGQGYVFNQGGNTTLVTDARGLDGVGCRTTGTAPLHCSGLYARFQSLGSIDNYSLRFESAGLMKYQNGVAGLDAEDPANVAHRFLYIASDNSANVQAVNVVGLNLNSSDNAVRALITASGLQTNTALFPRLAGNHPVGTALLPYSGVFYGAAATNNAQLTGSFTAARTHTGPDASGTLLISGNGDGTHSIKNQTLRPPGCATAAPINSTCDTTVTWATPFPDANYTASCTGEGVTSGVPIIEGIAISGAKSGTAMTVRTLAITAAAAQFTQIDCTAIHD